jgi:hypothetical protein
MKTEKKEGVRKVLYSPGYGAGWVSWAHGSIDQQRFMLEYKPFIEFLEKQGEETYHDRRTRKQGEEKTRLHEAHPLVEQFKKDWDAAFPESARDYPFFGGLDDLSIYEAPEHALVRIKEYDGSESVEVLGEDLGWL